MAVAAGRVTLGFLAVVAGCRREAGRALTIRAELDRSREDFGVVRIAGLPRGGDRRVMDVAGRLLVVYAVEGELSPGTPPLAGEWTAKGAEVEFRPRFPPAGGLAYVVVVDTSALAGRSAGGAVVRRFRVPDAPGSSNPLRVTIHPGAETVPENLLRWYLDFSARMRPGHALSHVRLLDQDGRDVPRAFLALNDELWDPTGTRLTLLFDPGRVKQGLRANLESGRPLRAGRRYTLRIDAGWPDASGRQLSQDVDRRFTAGPEDQHGPDPQRWTVAPPLVGTLDPLTIGFGEPLDHALAARLLAVHDSAGRLLDGRVELLEQDARWRFMPAGRWASGSYDVRVSGELEDLAGNRGARRFDSDQRAIPDSVGSRAMVLRFRARAR